MRDPTEWSTQMTLHPHPTDQIPAETARVARAIARKKGNDYLRMRDSFGTIFTDLDFSALYPRRGQPGYAPWRLALVTLVQYLEGLSDEQAAEAVRTRIDLKYLLGLPLEDTGFDPSVLSEFRTRLVEQEKTSMLFDLLLARLFQEGLVRPGGRVRTDSTHVLAAVQQLTRLALVRESVRHALNTLALAAPDWLVAMADPVWVNRYGARSENERLPKQAARRERLACQIGQDGSTVLAAVDAPAAPGWLRALPALQVLRRVWIEQYYTDDAGQRLRSPEELPPCSQAIASPHDTEVRRSWKRGQEWVGSKVHLTEACEPDRPRLITQVTTTAATVPDRRVTGAIQEALVGKDLAPDVQVADGGYVDADTLVESQQRHIRLLGPVQEDTSWQAKSPEAFTAREFAVDWEQEQVTCPAGATNCGWRQKRDQRGTEVIIVLFAHTACGSCSLRTRCTTSGRRTVTLRPRAQYEALAAVRAAQQTEAFQEAYAVRAGIEGTISQGVRRSGLRQARYRGHPKTSFQHHAIAAALNYQRTAEWLDDHTPATTRRAPLVRVLAPAA
jgi:transposase